MTSLFDLLQQIVATEGGEVKLKVPSEGVNLLSLKILKKEAKRRGKKLKLTASGPTGKRLIAALEDGMEPEPTKVLGGRFKMPRVKIGWSFFKRLLAVPILLFGILLLLGGGVYWAWNYLPRAEVTLTLKPIPMVKEVNVTAKSEADVINAEKNIIPGSRISVTEEGQKSVDATGSKTVGEKATGTVALTSTLDQHCDAGAKIKEDDSGLVFLLDSATDLETLTELSVSVTAQEIGNKYNVAADKTFHVAAGCANVSAVAGQNTTAFSGGESHEVTIVSSADQAKVLDELKSELIDKGKSSLEAQAGSDQVVYKKAIKQEVIERNFSQTVGEESNKAGLSLKMKFITVVYSESDLNEFISQVLGDLVPESYELFPGETAIEALDVNLKKGTKSLRFSAKVTAQVIPKLDIEGIKNSLAGLNTAGAQEYLSSLENVTGYELRLWPNLPESLKRVPRDTERISVELATEE